MANVTNRVTNKRLDAHTKDRI